MGFDVGCEEEEEEDGGDDDGVSLACITLLGFLLSSPLLPCCVAHHVSISLIKPLASLPSRC